MKKNLPILTVLLLTFSFSLMAPEAEALPRWIKKLFCRKVQRGVDFSEGSDVTCGIRLNFKLAPGGSRSGRGTVDYASVQMALEDPLITQAQKDEIKKFQADFYRQ
jgi:hypothetical protein